MLDTPTLALTILKVHLNGGSVRGFTHPSVQIFALSCLKEEDIVAVVKLCQFVQLIKLSFGVELRIFAAMWKQGVEVVDQMAMPRTRGW